MHWQIYDKKSIKKYIENHTSYWKCMIVDSLIEFRGPPNYVHYWVWIYKTWRCNVIETCVFMVDFPWSSPNHTQQSSIDVQLRKITNSHPHPLNPPWKSELGLPSTPHPEFGRPLSIYETQIEPLWA